MKVTPLTIRSANESVGAWHRHNKPVHGARWAIGAEHDGVLIGVAIVGRPIARKLDDGKTAEIVRVAVCDGAPKNACSFLYGACRRIWFSMGGTKVITYTLQSETGASLRGADFREAGRTDGGSWSRPSRERGTQDVQLLPKIRWESFNNQRKAPSATCAE